MRGWESNDWYKDDETYRKRDRDREGSRFTGGYSEVERVRTRVAKDINPSSEILPHFLGAAYAGVLFVGVELGKSLVKIVDGGWPHE